MVLQQKHQKQQAFEAELAANADRIATLITAGQNLIDSSKCSGGEVLTVCLTCSLPLFLDQSFLFYF